MLFLSVAAGTLLAWRATRPLREVSDTARRILETGDFAARVRAPNGSGELAVLVRQLNTLLDKNADARPRLCAKRSTISPTICALPSPGFAAPPNSQCRTRKTLRRRALALADCVNECDRVLHLLEALLDISAAEAGALKLNRDRLDVRTLTTVPSIFTAKSPRRKGSP